MSSIPMRSSSTRRVVIKVTLPRAFLLALVVEIVAIVTVMNVHIDTRAPAIEEPIVMEAIAPEPVKPIEPPPPPPPKPVRQIIKSPPKVVREAVPIKLDAPKPAVAPAPSPAAVSVPKDFGTQHQAEGKPDAPPTPPVLAVRHGVQRVGGEYPAYPEQALKRKIQGKVIAHLTVRPDGSVSEVTIVSAHPQGVFDTEVMRALKTWKFAPDPMGFIGEVEIGFTLPSDDDQ
ncbi:energy transducer TonB [Burkholderia pyrrocinia]|uniref:energy transducer TonB n=1 Tax=Burkholderia pyrrocinia TaxID=60550 RepID=UPI002AB175A4|nr:energy transducer TonB [Burkholderia pyrrocinia]